VPQFNTRTQCENTVLWKTFEKLFSVPLESWMLNSMPPLIKCLYFICSGDWRQDLLVARQPQCHRATPQLRYPLGVHPVQHSEGHLDFKRFAPFFRMVCDCFLLFVTVLSALMVLVHKYSELVDLRSMSVNFLEKHFFISFCLPLLYITGDLFKIFSFPSSLPPYLVFLRQGLAS
jgi:hypothetical protein